MLDIVKIRFKNFNGDVTFQGPMFDIHDNQNVYIGRQEKGCHSDIEEEESDDKNEDDELVANLKPLFYNNEENVRRFLEEIRGMAQEDITDLVNQWVEAKRISDYGNSRKGVLWGFLHKAGLYKRSKTNWNERVK